MSNKRKLKHLLLSTLSVLAVPAVAAILGLYCWAFSDWPYIVGGISLAIMFVILVGGIYIDMEEQADE